MAGQNTSEILLLNDANMIADRTTLGNKNENVVWNYGCPFERNPFLPKIDTNSGFGRD